MQCNVVAQIQLIGCYNGKDDHIEETEQEYSGNYDNNSVSNAL